MIYGNNVNKSGSAVVEDYLGAHSNPTDPAPSWATIDESVFYIVEDNQRTFNEMMMDLALNELSVLESTGQEVVYEDGGKIKGLVDKAVGAITKVWNNIQGAIKRAMDWFASKAKEFSNTIKRKMKIDAAGMKLRVANVKDDKSFGKTYSYNFGVVKQIIADIKSKNGDIDNAVKTANSDMQELSDTKGVKSDLNKELKGYVAAVKKKVGGDGETSNMSKAIKARIRGGESHEVKGSWVKSNWDSLVKEVEGYSAAKKEMKTEYNDLKQTFNNIISQLKGQGKMSGFDASVYTAGASAYHQLSQIATVANNASLSCLTENYRFQKSVVTRVMFASAKKKEEKANASYEYDGDLSGISESTTYDRVSSLFAW